MGVAFSAWLFVLVPREHGAGSGRVVVLRFGAPLRGEEVLARLQSEGFLRHPDAVKLWLSASESGVVAAAGVHVLRDDLTPLELVRRLRRQKAARVRVTFPEGFGASEMGDRLEAVGICAASEFKAFAYDGSGARALGLSGSSVEGYMYPATYDLAGNSTAEDVARAMLARFEKVWAGLVAKHPQGETQLYRRLNWDRNAVVVMASLVEKEAAVDDERALVASVFLNRLTDPGFKPKLLQSDPTAVYGCRRMASAIPSCAGFTGKATHAIVVDGANPWTTYKHEGLPPTPIANPGERAMEAVLAPAPGNYLYFVARGDRRHAFAATYTEHLENIKKMPR